MLEHADTHTHKHKAEEQSGGLKQIFLQKRKHILNRQSHSRKRHNVLDSEAWGTDNGSAPPLPQALAGGFAPVQ